VRARIVLTATAVLALLAPAAHAAFPGKNGLIAFEKAKRGLNDIWVMSPNGGKPRDVTATRRAAENFASFAPNGRTLAFIWFSAAIPSQQKNGIGIVNSDGTGYRRLTSAPTDTVSYFNPRFTADGKTIVFWKSRPSTNGLDSTIWAIPAKGGAERQLTSGPDCCELPSPDGRHLAYVHTDENQPEAALMIADPNGANPVQVSTHYPSDWAPDGSRFILEGPGNDVFTFNADGSNFARLVGQPTHDETPVFSPDGHFVVWTNEATHDLWIARSDGSGARNLSHTPGFEKDPSWGPAAKGKKKKRKH
jgi:Tol biopolymer transport system component